MFGQTISEPICWLLICLASKWKPKHVLRSQLEKGLLSLGGVMHFQESSTHTFTHCVVSDRNNDFLNCPRYYFSTEHLSMYWNVRRESQPE